LGFPGRASAGDPRRFHGVHDQEFGDGACRVAVNEYQQKKTGRSCIVGHSKDAMPLSQSVRYLDELQQRIAKRYADMGIALNVVAKHEWPDED
jgi:hypothetical protein